MRIVVLVLTLLAASSAAAGPIRGSGVGSCGEWIEERKQGAYYATLHWMQGFISAYNEYVYSGRNPNGVFSNADHKAIAVWMDNYCQLNPLSTPHRGTVLLIKELERRAN